MRRDLLGYIVASLVRLPNVLRVVVLVLLAKVPGAVCVYLRWAEGSLSKFGMQYVLFLCG